MKIGIFLTLLITSLAVYAEENCSYTELNKNWTNIWFIEFQTTPATIWAKIDTCLTNQENIKNVSLAIDSSLSKLYAEDKSRKEALYDFNKSIIKHAADKEIPLFQFYFAWLHNNNFTWLSELEPKDYYTFIYWTKKAASNGDANAKLALAKLSSGSFLTRYSNAPESMYFPFLTLSSEDAIGILNTINDKQLASVFQMQGTIENLKAELTGTNMPTNSNILSPKITADKNYQKPVWLKGYIGSESLITMILYPTENGYSGIYFYDSAYKKWKSSFPIKGKRTNKNLIIEALDKHGNPIEKFDLTIKGIKNDEIYYANGDWTSENSKQKVQLGDVVLFDNFVSCEEMQLAPDFAFTRELDFGAGIASNMTDVADDCPRMTNNIEFTKKAAALATEIRTPKGAGYGCYGSGIHVLNRHDAYNRAMAAYAPGIYLKKYQQSFEKSKSNIDNWSTSQKYNKNLAAEFIKELKYIKPQLKTHFLQTVKKDDSAAELFSQASTKALLHHAVGDGNVDSPKTELIDLYEKKGISAIKATAEDKRNIQNSLNYAILNEYSEDLIITLIDLNTDLNYGNESPIFYAINNKKYLDLLLIKGADINYQNSFGKTPIFYAIQDNDTATVEFLISKGANVNHKYKSKADYNNEEMGSADYYCINKKGRTTLMHAAQHASLEMVKLLVNKGADSKATDDNGDTAADYAKEANHTDILNYLNTL